MHVDEQAFSILESLPNFPFNRLVRQDRGDLVAQRQAFFNDGVLPTFTYSVADRFDTTVYTEALQRAREELEISRSDEAVRELYKKKFNELETRNNLISALQGYDDAASSNWARQLFGSSQGSAASYQQEFAKHLERGESLHEHRRPISAETFVMMIERILQHYQLSNWQIKLSKRSTVIVSSNKTGLIIRVPERLAISKQRAVRLLTHEIEVHALRTANSFQAPLKLLRRGLAGYLETEEGLAMYFQEQVLPQASRPGFWNARAVALMTERGFAEAGRTLQTAKVELLKARRSIDAQERSERFAWKLCIRATRGIRTPGMPGLVYPKDRIYRDGYDRVVASLTERPTDLGLLFAGNLGLDDVSRIEEMHLSPAKTPDLVSRQVVNQFLREQK